MGNLAATQRRAQNGRSDTANGDGTMKSVKWPALLGLLSACHDNCPGEHGKPRRMRIVLVGVLLISGAAAAHARGSNGKYWTIGPGNESCGTWTTDHLLPNSVSTYMADSWVTGFLSGIGSAVAGADPLRGTDSNGVVGWIDNYCRAHPVETVAGAATAFAQFRARGRQNGATAQLPTEMTSGTEFLAMYDGADAAWRSDLGVLVLGTLNGLTTADNLLVMRHQAPLYCAPDKAGMSGKMALDMMRKQLTATPAAGSMPWGFFLWTSLFMRFPCPPS